MMENAMSRRKFLRKTSLSTAGLALSLGSVKSRSG
ncbi:twin-arginine translocation signal domain-containing protein, partial [bacterium]|nr:twin-arginine translocation signal domain-containing protein [bacterium]